MVLFQVKVEGAKVWNRRRSVFFRHFVEENVWRVVLACYLVVGVDNRAFVDRDREARLLINGDGIKISIIGSPAQ